MKHFLTTSFLFLILAMAGIAKAQQWTELQTGIDEDLYDVHCIDANTALVCGENGVILKTEDGGYSWQEKFRKDGCYLYNVFFVDNLTGFASGTLLVKTTDGGNNWVQVDTRYPYLIDQIFALDADTLYFVSDLELFKSTDGGITASLLLQVYPNYWHHDGHTWKLYFEDNVGYFAYAADELGVYKTTDYGNTWEKVLDITDYYLPSLLHFFNKNKAKFFNEPVPESYLDGDNVICTEDGFSSTFQEKSYIDYGVSAFFLDSKFTSQETGCFIARTELYEEGYCFAAVTKDGGTHWSYRTEGLHDEINLNGVDGIDTVYFLTADNGYVYRTWRTTDEIDESILSDVFFFPNPVGQTLYINAENAKTIEIIDNMGRNVINLPVKQDHITVDCSKLGIGVYVVVITDNSGKRHIKKLVLS